jgi:hypothetical protein
MLVSDNYGSVLMLLSFLAAQILLWMLNIRQLFYPTLGEVFGFLVSVSLGLPLGFLILTVLVRTAPRVVEPKLVARHWDPLITLGLSTKHDHAPSAEEERKKEER